jgi:hypothetical protein
MQHPTEHPDYLKLVHETGKSCGASKIETLFRVVKMADNGNYDVVTIISTMCINFGFPKLAEAFLLWGESKKPHSQEICLELKKFYETVEIDEVKRLKYMNKYLESFS